MNNEIKLPELYVATDVEADGPIPGDIVCYPSVWL